MRLGQFEFQSKPDTHANAGNYTVTYSSSNSQPVTNSIPDAGTIECRDHGARG